MSSPIHGFAEHFDCLERPSQNQSVSDDAKWRLNGARFHSGVFEGGVSGAKPASKSEVELEVGIKRAWEDVHILIGPSRDVRLRESRVERHAVGAARSLGEVPL